MLDKIIGLAAIALLIAFAGILIVFVPSIDLILIVGVVSAMAAYDFYRTLFKRKNGNR
ncbi:MAG: hypothetical protein ACFB13_23675 [Kiloniellaceae bacterium]